MCVNKFVTEDIEVFVVNPKLKNTPITYEETLTPSINLQTKEFSIIVPRFRSKQLAVNDEYRNHCTVKR